MKQIPWKGLAFGSGLLAFLVLGRCIVTVGRLLYYGSNYWQSAIMEGPWFYIGMVAAAVCVAALLVLSDQATKKREETTETDGCE